MVPETATFCIYALLLIGSGGNAFLTNEAEDWHENFYSGLQNYFDARAPSKDIQKVNENAVEPPLKIGSFNIQTLTDKKFTRPNVMSVIEKVILRYDLILLMELMTFDNTPMKNLLQVVNRLAPDGVTYDMTIGTRHPYTKEHYAFIYRTDKLKVFKAGAYYDADKIFYRRPFIVTFNALTLRDMDRFVVVGHHVKPNLAVQEINGLATVYDYIRQTYGIEDVLIMGDFNADCSYVRESDWENITLWTREEFFWPIKSHYDTTTNYKSCALDRFVYAGSKMNEGVVDSSAQIFNFQEAYGLSTAETREISDHWPIEIQIRGKMSKRAEKNLSSNTCVTVTDKAPVAEPNPETYRSKASAAGFSLVVDLKDHILLLNQTGSERALMRTLKVLPAQLPEMVSSDQAQATAYKVQYGSLHDKSSFAPQEKVSFWIAVQHQNKTNTLTVCKRSTVN